MLERLVFAFSLFCAAAAPSLIDTAREPEGLPSQFPGFPARFLAMRELELSPVELRFAQDFPGRIGKFEHHGMQYIVRFIAKPTRMLHPAIDCFRASGFSTTPLPRCEFPQAEATGCFRAESSEVQFLVSESINDAQGHVFDDVSAWYFATQTGGTQGPWWSVTTVSSCLTGRC